jgi:hypothetical protein
MHFKFLGNTPTKPDGKNRDRGKLKKGREEIQTALVYLVRIALKASIRHNPYHRTRLQKTTATSATPEAD